MSKQIQLTRGMVALVDGEDFERINTYKWCVLKHHSGRFYAIRFTGPRIFRKVIYMHRDVMNAPRRIEVDHIHPEDTLDNRKANLRLCTHAENLHNHKKNTNNTSGYKGVSWNSRYHRWEAKIGFDNKHIWLGIFGTAEDAARAYDNAAKEHHGEFAKTNF